MPHRKGKEKNVPKGSTKPSSPKPDKTPDTHKKERELPTDSKQGE